MSEIETLRIQLAACATAAMMNTEKGVAERIGRDNPYWSDSYSEVCKAVDREIALRDKRDEEVRKFLGWLSGDIPELHSVEVPRLADSWERFQVEQIIKGRSAESEEVSR